MDTLELEVNQIRLYEEMWRLHEGENPVQVAAESLATSLAQFLLSTMQGGSIGQMKLIPIVEKFMNHYPGLGHINQMKQSPGTVFKIEGGILTVIVS